MKLPSEAIDEEEVKPVLMVNGVDKESLDNDFVSGESFSLKPAFLLSYRCPLFSSFSNLKTFL